MNATDRDPKGLFLVREIQQENNVADCQNALDAWSANIPFSPIKRFSVQTQFVSATEYAAYKTTVTSQIESRWLQEHEVSYSDQPVPETPVPLSGIDAWKVEFSKFADFKPHKQSLELPQTRRVFDCPECATTGRVRCPQVLWQRSTHLRRLRRKRLAPMLGVRRQRANFADALCSTHGATGQSNRRHKRPGNLL